MENILKAKNEVANYRGFIDWTHLLEHYYKGLFEIQVLDDIISQVAYMYAKNEIDNSSN